MPCRTWEVRRYWHSGRIVDTAWWRAGRLAVHRPHQPARTVADYCAAHGTRISADLPCQYCQERPGQARS